MVAGWLKPNTHRRRRRDSTVELSCVGCVYGIRDWLATVSTSLNECANSESSCVVSENLINKLLFRNSLLNHPLHPSEEITKIGQYLPELSQK